MPSILFVCTANQFRSPLAAACLKKLIQEKLPQGEWLVGSAGTWIKDGLPAPQLTLLAARSLGLTGLEGHKTRQVSQILLEKCDLVLVMESGHKEALRYEFPDLAGRIFLLSEIVDGVAYDIPDPAHPSIDPEVVAQTLLRLIQKGYPSIFSRARERTG
jgi:protein-tyrosine-phosphatase